MKDLLFAEFSPATETDWIEKIKKELKNISFEQLYTPTYEGIILKPFYTQNDCLLQKAVPLNKKRAGWQNCVKVSTEKMLNEPKYLASLLNKGAESFWIDLRTLKTIPIFHWNTIFEEVDTTQLTITMQCHQNTQEHLEALSSFKFQGLYLCYDALHHYATQGEMQENFWQHLYAILQNSDLQVDKFLINAQHWNNAGANAVQELAFSLCTAIEYAHQLTELGAEASKILAKIGFSLSVGNHFFMEIAKFNVLPLLWANICHAYNHQPEDELFVHAQNNTWNKLQADAYNNMLRATTESMAAVLGGCHSLTVLPYNLSLEDDFASRIARNVSIILKEESHLDKTLNPTTGTYFLEKLQTELAHNAWHLLQEIESKGGFLANLQNNSIQMQIQTICEQRLQDLENQKLILIGLNKYPNPTEPTPSEKPHFISLSKF
ncbi:MAG: methylmalonyl-CoA mutase family protein [Microscillaceae bacterium]|nr:methylmalonyl-CoA mutase family protein [Microscillaceae bacterium]MDW8459953.1 methylmalonyl-CoA mutase family protein [Cytophagales bacterium]